MCVMVMVVDAKVFNLTFITLIMLQIMGAVEKYFSNPCVKEHLQQAIASMERDHLLSPTTPQVQVMMSKILCSIIFISYCRIGF